MKWLDKLPFAPVVGTMFGLVASFLTMVTPGWLFERAVVASALPSLLSAAQPPLGDTARLLAAIVIGFAVAAVLWGSIAAIVRFAGPKRAARSPKAHGVRIDPEHPFASHRPPIFAQRDLGAPFMSDEAMELARSELILDTPLDEFPPEPQPIEIAETPEVHEVYGKEALAEQPEPAFAETPPPLRVVRPVESESVSALMARLEAAMARRMARNIQGSPLPMGDLASLRRALGASR